MSIHKTALALSTQHGVAALGCPACKHAATLAERLWGCCMPQVENYMTQIVSKMRGELRDVLRDSVVDYTTKPRDKWLFDWPSQIILVVNQVFWCQEVEQVRGPVAPACSRVWSARHA